MDIVLATEFNNSNLIPDTYSYDSFNRANGPVTFSETGQAWNLENQFADKPFAARTLDNRLNMYQTVGTGSDPGRSYLLLDDGQADGIIEARAMTTNTLLTRNYLVVRAVDPTSLIFVGVSSFKWNLYTRSGSASTLVLNGTIDGAASGDLLRVHSVGNQISLYVNDVLSIAPITVSHVPTATKHGFGYWGAAGVDEGGLWEDYSHKPFS